MPNSNTKNIQTFYSVNSMVWISSSANYCIGHCGIVGTKRAVRVSHKAKNNSSLLLFLVPVVNICPIFPSVFNAYNLISIPDRLMSNKSCWNQERDVSKDILLKADITLTSAIYCLHRYYEYGFVSNSTRNEC